jgi:hypothetical protein
VFRAWKNVAISCSPTLRKAVEAMGGDLSLVAEFPDRAPVLFSGMADDHPRLKPAGQKSRTRT